MSERELLELRYIAAAMTPGIGGATLKSLLASYGSIESVFDAFGYAGAPTAINKIAGHWRSGGEVEARAVRHRTAAVPGHVVVWEDDDYPIALRSVSNPPGVLYVRGDIGRLSSRALAIVGTTDPAPTFARAAAHLARSCADFGIQVVSGLARGIDTTALRAASELEVPCFAVVGHGIDFEYPASSGLAYQAVARTGAVISQFPTGQGPQRWTFPMRNEVMCTLAYGTVIIQAHEKDGSLIQADFSFKHGRDVLIYSANRDLPDHEWVGRLEARGALLFDTIEQVIDVVSIRHDQFRGLTPEPEPEPPLVLFDAESPRPDESRALLVDIDGVLADTEPWARDASVEALSRFNVTVPSEAAMGLGRRRPAQIARDYEIEWKAFKSAYDPALERLLGAHDLINHSVREALLAAKQRGWRLAAVTSQPKRRAMLMLKDEAALFDEIVTYNDTPGRAKPDPFPFVLAMQRLGVSPGSCLAIGDTHSDILAARAAKVRAIAVMWGYESETELRRYSPDFLIETPAEISDVLRDSARVPVA